MKFRVLIQIEGNDKPHWETYEEDCKDAADCAAWVEKTIAHFNDTLRPHEKSRSVVGIEMLDLHSVKNHWFQKQNLTTLSSPQGYYDKVKCKRCGVVARRYGLARIVYQKPYIGKIYKRCDTARAHIEAKATVS